MAQKASQLGLRRIEIDRGLSEEPKLLRKGLIMPEEVDKLFQIYYEKLNVTVNLLDPVLHTPETTFARCPLLFTVGMSIYQVGVIISDLLSLCGRFAILHGASRALQHCHALCHGLCCVFADG
jgi:hypothetical protein